MNKYIDIIISQNTTKFMHKVYIYSTTTCFGRPTHNNRLHTPVTKQK